MKDAVGGKTWRLLGFIFLLALGAAGCAEVAQPTVTQPAATPSSPPPPPAAQAPSGPVAEAPKMNQGDEWNWNSLAAGPVTTKVVGFEGESTITTSTHPRCAGCKQVRDRNMTIVKSTGGRDLVGVKFLDFPLFVGKKWDSRSESVGPRGDRVYVDRSCAVVAFEPVTVPAGRFDAYKIQCDLSIRSPWSWSGSLAYWYAPKTKSSVKISALRGDWWEKPEDELASYKLKD